MKILIVDDDIPCVKFITYLLEDSSYQVLQAYDGPAVPQVIARHKPDLVLLDIRLPSISGYDLCRQIRRMSEVPIIFLSSCAQVDERVRGLQAGGDDYIIKPFEPADLLVRIQAVLRRCQQTPPVVLQQITHADITARPLDYTLQLGDRVIGLTPIEFHLLYYLMVNAGNILNIPQILNNVWGYEEIYHQSLVTTYISRLRMKIERDPLHPRRIVTVRNVGYRFQATLDQAET